MAIEGVLSAIDRFAKAEIKQIEVDAQVKAEGVIADANAKAEREVERFVAESVATSERESVRQIHSAELASVRAQADVRRQAYEELFVLAKKRIEDVRGHSSYADLLASLIADATQGLGIDYVIHIDPRDSNLVASFKPTGQVVADITTAGGVIVVSSSGRVTRDNTFEARLERVRDERVQDVWEVLNA